MNDLTAALLLCLSLTVAQARANSRGPQFPAADLRSTARAPQAKPQISSGTSGPAQYQSLSNHSVANQTSSNNVSLIASPSLSSTSSLATSSIPSFQTSSSPSDGSSAPTYHTLNPSASSASPDFLASPLLVASTHSLRPNATANTPHNSSLQGTSDRPSPYFLAGSVPSSRSFSSSLNGSVPTSISHSSISASMFHPEVSANSSGRGHRSSSAADTATTHAYPAASLQPHIIANFTPSSSPTSYTGVSNETRKAHDSYNATTAKPTGPRPTCHQSYIAALNSGVEGALKGNMSDELCDACPQTADVLKYRSRPAPGVDQIGHDYAMSCNIAWLQYSKHSSMWWELVGSKSTSYHPMSTGSTSRVLGRVADPTVLADGFTRMKGASTLSGAWVPTATEEVRTERLPPPSTSTTYHKACIDPMSRDSPDFQTKFPNQKPQCEIGPAQCQYLNHKHAVASENVEDDNDDINGVQAPICGNRAFNYSTCSIYASKVQIFYWPDVTDVHESPVSTTPAHSIKPRSAVVGGQTMVSPYVYLSLQRIGLAKTWIVDFTSSSAAKDLPEATNTLLQLAPELLSTVVYTVPGCKGLCAHHLQSIFSTPPSGDPRHRLHFTAQPYNPATLNHSNPVPASAYFWGRVDAGSNLGRVPLPLLYYHPKQQIIWDDYLPQIAVPNDIRKLGPNGTWEGCGLGMGGIYDPPYALEAGSTVAAPDITPPGGVQPTSTPASPANGYQQAPAPTVFGGPAMPTLTPPSSGPSTAQSSSTPLGSTAENGFGKPLSLLGVASAMPPSDGNAPAAPTSFGQTVPNLAANTNPSVPESPIRGATVSQPAQRPATSDSLVAESIRAQSPNGLVAVAFNPNGNPTTPGNSAGIPSSGVAYPENSVAGSEGLLGSGPGAFPSLASNSASPQGLSSVIEGAVVAMSLPKNGISTTSISTLLDAASYATSPALSDAPKGVSLADAATKGGSSSISPGAVSGGTIVLPADQDSSAMAPFGAFKSSTSAPSNATATSTNALATHTLIRNIFGDVVATAAVVAGQTIVAGGPPATINGNSVSFSPGGQALVVNEVTTASFAMTTGRTSHAVSNSATAYQALITGADSTTTTGAALYGTTLSAGGSSLVYSGHTYSAEASGNVIVDGSRTIHLQASTSVPFNKETATKAMGTITTAAMTIGPSETLCATETAVTDFQGKMHNVVYIGSQTASVGQTVTTAGMAVTVASNGLVYDATTATFSTTKAGFSSPGSPITSSASSPSTPLSPLQADNTAGIKAGTPRTSSSSTNTQANAAKNTSPQAYRLFGALGPVIAGLSLVIV